MSNWLGVAATKAAWNAKVETSSQRLMLLSIARYADDNGKAFPSVDSICADTCLSRNTAFKVLKELKNLGLIAVEKRQNNANQYTLSVDYSDSSSTKTGSTNIATTKTGTTKIGTTGSTNIATTVVPKLVHEENKEENKEKNSSCAPSSTESVTPPPADFTFIANDEYDAQGYLIQPEPVEAVKADKPKKEKKPSKKHVLIKPDDCSQSVFDEWVAYKNSLNKAGCSQRMVDFIVREAKSAGVTSERAMIIAMERGWQSFRASYDFSSKGVSGANTFGKLTPQQQREVEEIMAERKAQQHQQHQEPSFRNLSTSAKDEFDAGALDLLQGVL